MHGLKLASASTTSPRELDPAVARRWSLATLGGRFVELSGRGATALLSVAFRLVLEAQRQGKNVAWLSLGSAKGARPTPFHAPDVAAAGIALEALPVVIAKDPLAAGRAASHLLRSGAFALVVLDLVMAGGLDPPEPGFVASAGDDEIALPLPLQSRLTGLAQTHGSALVALTDKPPHTSSLGSLVSLHAHVVRTRLRVAAPDGHARFEVELVAHKDKRHGPGWSHREVFRAPAGIF